ncbi:hypothetical protein CAEBREN_24135 [Caenorhabditis brenneri]|uniref:Uncharacterized protein n=1 Tax=Caenorhabditis brenneri TaxID=135651 RepID=G0NVV8_CAEBE|nr:hypothetical protein CAEBREN_24135 [Caenorhabditis brenneri]
MGDQPQESNQQLPPSAKHAQSDIPANSRTNKSAGKTHVPVIDIDSFSPGPQSPSQTRRPNQRMVSTQDARFSDVAPRNLRSRDASGKFTKNSDKNLPTQAANSSSKSKKSGSKHDVIRVNHRTIGKSNGNNGNNNGNRNQQGNNKRGLPKEPVSRDQPTLLCTASPTKKAPPQIIAGDSKNAVDIEEPTKEIAVKEQDTSSRDDSIAQNVVQEKSIVNTTPKKEKDVHSIKEEEEAEKSLSGQPAVNDNSIIARSPSPTIQNDTEKIEADIGIKSTTSTPNFAQVVKCDNPKPLATQVIESPKSSCIDLTPTKFENIELHQQAEATIKRLAAEFDGKRKFKMFLPNAFNDASTESTIGELYGRFSVRDVTVHYTKNGERFGSGTMRVIEENTERVRNWAPERDWRALRMMPLRKRDINRLADCMVKIYFEFGFSWTEEKIESFQRKIRELSNATELQIFYNLSGQCMKTGFAEMTYAMADKIEATTMFHESKTE